MKTIDPEEIVFCITMLDLARAIERRIGKEEASTLAVDDLRLVKEEVQIAFEEFDPRSYIDMGLDAWEITRKL